MSSDNDGKNPWGKNNSPWGSSNNGNQGGGNSSIPPDLEDILKGGQTKIKQLFPRNKKRKRKTKYNNNGFLLIFLAIALLLWGISGFYQVQPEEQGVVLRFGKYAYSTTPGLHYHLPYPVERAFTPNVMRENRIEIGFRSSSPSFIRRNTKSDSSEEVSQESLMVTGDENIVDINYTVIWVVNNAPDYLFNVRDPVGTVTIAAESAMREVIGQMPIQKVLTEGRRDIEEKTLKTLQAVLDEFGSGILIKRINLLKTDPPQLVVDAFNEVQRAKADQERSRNEAEGYRNDIIPRARGEAIKKIQDAEAYAAEVVNRASGDAGRFKLVYDGYVKAKNVTAKRMFLETMEQILQNSNKVIIDTPKNGNGVIPYLPLDVLKTQKEGKN
ncbi:MAG: FtsH protease activity modulator HflK [Alphaproteobacteria bacterium]